MSPLFFFANLSIPLMKGGVFMKTLFNAVLYGAAATLGGILVTHVINVCGDPVKKAEFKRGCKTIKNAFTKTRNEEL